MPPLGQRRSPAPRAFLLVERGGPSLRSLGARPSAPAAPQPPTAAPGGPPLKFPSAFHPRGGRDAASVRRQSSRFVLSPWSQDARAPATNRKESRLSWAPWVPFLSVGRRRPRPRPFRGQLPTAGVLRNRVLRRCTPRGRGTEEGEVQGGGGGSGGRKGRRPAGPRRASQFARGGCAPREGGAARAQPFRAREVFSE